MERLTQIPGLYYVNSNTLLAELRGLTRNYPFRLATTLSMVPKVE